MRPKLTFRLSPDCLAPLATAALCCLPAMWAGWRLSGLVAPLPLTPYAEAPAEPAGVAARIAGRHWFGVAAPLPAPVLRVLGVFSPGASPERGSFAVIERDGRTLSWQGGADAGDGWHLARIVPDGLWLAGPGGQTQFYPLAAAAAPVSAADAEPPEGPAAPPGDD